MNSCLTTSGRSESKALPTIKDETGLLDLLLQEEKAQDQVWRVSRYWTYYMDMITAEIRSEGLSRFRSNDRIASSFCSTRPSLPFRSSAPELDEWNEERGTHQGSDSTASRMIPTAVKKWVSRHALRWPLVSTLFRWFRLPNLSVMADRHFLMSLRMAEDMMRQSAETSAWIRSVSDSGLGHPTDLVRSAGGRVGQDMLYGILYLSLLSAAMRERPLRRVIEIGGGYGCLCETMVKGLPELETYVIFDLPQTCYVTTQYLKSVFPGQVWDYRDMAAKSVIREADLAGKKITVLPTWAMPRLDLRFDCLVNTASFQEMEPDTVRHYARQVSRLTGHVFCWALREGHGRGFNQRTVSLDTIRSAFEENGYAAAGFEAADTRKILALLQPMFADLFVSRPR